MYVCMYVCIGDVKCCVGVCPADVVDTIAYHADIPGYTIGEINILDRHTLVDVPQQYVAQTLAKAGKYRIRKNSVTLEIA